MSSSITSSTIIGISCAILVLLYAVQPLGITKIASSFGPVVIIWLILNAVVAIYVRNFSLFIIGGVLLTDLPIELGHI